MRPALLASCILFAGMAHAHDAPLGWRYGADCCSNRDCRMVNHGGVRVDETPAGYRISTTGEIVPYRDARIKISPDGEFHWCSYGGGDRTRTICLYAPPKGY